MDEEAGEEINYANVREISRLNAHIDKLDAELKAMRTHYGFVASPERIWQGECGHLWRHDGKGEAHCPICAELEQTKADAALVVHALDTAVQLTEMLILFTPEGTVLPAGVATAKHALDEAMNAIRQRQPKP